MSTSFKFSLQTFCKYSNIRKIESGENDHAEPSHTNSTRKHNKKVKQIIS